MADARGAATAAAPPSLPPPPAMSPTRRLKQTLDKLARNCGVVLGIRSVVAARAGYVARAALMAGAGAGAARAAGGGLTEAGRDYSANKPNMSSDQPGYYAGWEVGRRAER